MAAAAPQRAVQIGPRHGIGVDGPVAVQLGLPAAKQQVAPDRGFPVPVGAGNEIGGPHRAVGEDRAQGALGAGEEPLLAGIGDVVDVERSAVS